MCTSWSQLKINFFTRRWAFNGLQGIILNFFLSVLRVFVHLPTKCTGTCYVIPWKFSHAIMIIFHFRIQQQSSSSSSNRFIEHDVSTRKLGPSSGTAGRRRNPVVECKASENVSENFSLCLQCIQKFFSQICLILKNRFLVRLSSNFQERLFMPFSRPEFLFWWGCF